MVRVDLLRLAALLSLLPAEERKSGVLVVDDRREPLPREPFAARLVDARHAPLPTWTLGQGSPWPPASSKPPPLPSADAERVRLAEEKRARKAAKLEALAAKGAIRKAGA